MQSVCVGREQELSGLWPRSLHSRQSFWVTAMEGGDNGKLLSNTPSLGPESSVMVVVGTVPLALFCLTLPGWNHCLISRKKGHWGPNILSSTTPKLELPWRLGRKSNPTCHPLTPNFDSITDRWGQDEKYWHPASPGMIALQLGAERDGTLCSWLHRFEVSILLSRKGRRKQSQFKFVSHCFYQILVKFSWMCFFSCCMSFDHNKVLTVFFFLNIVH